MIRGLRTLWLPILIAAATASGAGLGGICAALPDGAAVRLALLDGATVEGRVCGWDGARLRLVQSDGITMDYPLADAAALWIRARHTSGGLKVGAMTGGLAGGLGMAGLLILVSAAQDDGLGEAVVPLMLMGVGAGAGLGALVGGVTGSSLPDWDLAWALPGWSTSGDRTVARRPLRTGGLEFLLGASNGGDRSPDEGLGIGGRWRSELSPRWSTGLEIVRLEALQPNRYSTNVPNFRYELGSECWLLGTMLQANLATDAVRPFVMAGVGGYWWNDHFLGGSWGGGLEVDLGPHFAGRLEYRRHGNIQRLVGSDPALQSLLTGMTWTW